MESTGNVLILGSNGQIGIELILKLREMYGNDYVIASDIKDAPDIITDHGPFEFVDVLNKDSLDFIFKKYQPTQVYHLAALLSAVGEQNPKLAWDINIQGLLNVLDVCRRYDVQKVYWPSSIAVFGPNSPKVDTPQYCPMDPTTVYGISKMTGERLCEYYFLKYGLDIRSLRYPGIISYKSMPGGGTTDYAVHIFHEAKKTGKYESFINGDTNLPMMYMDDAIRATIEIMEAPAENIKIRSSYNLAGISFNPEDLAKEIRNHIPDFEITYKPDSRQEIAASWPESIRDTRATEDWGWELRSDLKHIVADMLKNV